MPVPPVPAPVVGRVFAGVALALAAAAALGQDREPAPVPDLPAAGEASMYVLMFLVLMFRPRGLLGERIERFE